LPYENSYIEPVIFIQATKPALNYLAFFAVSTAGLVAVSTFTAAVSTLAAAVSTLAVVSATTAAAESVVAGVSVALLQAAKAAAIAKTKRNFFIFLVFYL
jgi:hypothetical protein